MIRNNWKKVTAVLLIVCFTAFDIAFAQPLPLNELLQYAPQEKKVDESSEPSPAPQDGFFMPDSLSFLESEGPLSPVEEKQSENVHATTRQDVRPERLRFEDAVEEFRPEYASAVILEDISVENLKTLIRLGFETALTVIEGEIVLFSTGNKHEIGYTEPVRQLMQEADFISHVHTEDGAEGPSEFDLKEGMVFPKTEYVVTQQGVYEYNRAQILNVERPYPFQAFIDALLNARHKARESLAEKASQRAVRAALNEFIAGMDAFNSALDKDRLTFRRGDRVEEVLTYDSAGNVSVRQRTTYNELGRITAYETISYIQNVRSNRGYYEYDQQGRWTLSQVELYFGSGALQSRNQTQYSEGKITGNSVNEYYADGRVKANDATTYGMGTGLPQKRVSTAYDALGRVSQAVEQLYDSAGKIQSYEDKRYENGIQWIRWYYQYDSEGRWSANQEDRFDAAGTLSVRSWGQYQNGLMSVSARDEYFADGTYKSKDKTTYKLGAQGIPQVRTFEGYDTLGAIIQKVTHLYTPDGKNKSYDDTRYLNGVALIRWYYEYDAEGRFSLTQEDRFFSNGILQSRSATRYSNGYLSSQLTEAYNSNAIPKSKDFLEYWPGAGQRLRKNHSESYDETGRVTRMADLLYDENGKIKIYDDLRFANDLRTIRWYYEYDVQGRFTLQQEDRYDSLGRILTITMTRSSEGKKLSDRVDTYLSTGRLKRTQFYQMDAVTGKKSHYLDYNYENENSPWFYDYRYDAAGTMLERKTIELLSPLKTNQSSYILVYRVDGQIYNQSQALIEGENKILRLDAVGLAVEIPVSLKTSDFRLELIQPIPSRTANRSMLVRYKAGTVEKSKTLELLEGPNRFIITDTDANGYSSALQIDVVLDTTPPRIVLLSPAPAARTKDANLTVTYTADQVEKTKTYVLTEGSNAITFSEKDDLGNEIIKSWAVVLDTTPPAIVMTAAVPALTRSANFTAQYTADGTAKEKAFQLVEGANTVSIIESDDLGNQTVKTFAVTLDSIAPEVVIAGSLPAKTKLSQWTISYTVDGVSKEKIFTLQEGVNTLEISAEDAAGNRTVKTRTIERDTTPPVITVTSTVPVRTKTTALSIAYTIDGIAQTKQVQLLEGSNMITLSALDDLGNEELKSMTVVLDTQAPEIIVMDLIAPKTKAAQMTVHFTADGAAREKSFDLQEGANDLRLEAEDDVGNQALKIVGVVRDSTPPVIHLAGPVPSRTKNKTLVIPYTADGIAHEQTFQLTEGDNALSIKAQDELGNEAVYSVSVVLDTAGPEIALSAPLTARTNKSSISLAYTADGISKEQHFDLIEGVNTLTLTAADDLGNTTIKTYEVTRDTQGPVLMWDSLVPQTAEVSFTLRYKVDGVLREKLWDLQGQPGLREMEIIETDDLGNESRLTASIQFDPPDYEHILTDGTVRSYRARILREETFPSGVKVLYDGQGRVETNRYAEGQTLNYLLDAEGNGILLKDAQGVAVETLMSLTVPELNSAELVRTVLENGMAVYYRQGEPVLIEMPSGTRLYDFAFAADGSFTKALLVHPNGRLEAVRNGVVILSQNPDGSRQDYLPDGRLVREITANATGWYFYQKDSSAKIIETTLKTNASEFVTYGADGLLNLMVTANAQYHYGRYETEDEVQVLLDSETAVAPDERIPMQFVYSREGQLKSIEYSDESRATFVDGALRQYVDSDGNAADYQEVVKDGITVGTAVERQGAKLIYDAEGFLQEIESEQGSVILQRSASSASDNHNALSLRGSETTEAISDEDVIDILLETVGGDKLSDFELDSEGRLLKGILETKEGIKQTIEDGVLTGFETVDGKIYGVRQTQLGASEAYLKEWNFKNGTRVIYGGGAIAEIIYPDGKRLNTIGFNADKKIETVTEELPDGTKRFFKNNRLVKVILPTGAEINYDADGMAQKITLPDASEEIVAYARDSAGKVEAVIFTGDHVRRVFKADGTLLSLLTQGLSAEIESNQVARIFTRFGEIESPQFNSQGAVSGNVSLVDGTQLVVTEGDLTRAIKPNGTVIFYDKGRISAIESASIHYDLVYLMDEQGALESVHLHYTESGAPVDVSLVPYLLAHPGNELAAILFPRALYNSLEDRSEVRSELDSNDLFFSKIVEDSTRDTAYEFASDYFPELNFETNTHEAYLAYPDAGRYSGTNYPITRSSLMDINGDGRADRIYVDPDNTKWWVQLSNGIDFEAPVIWTGIQGVKGVLDDQSASIRSFDGRSESQLNDFLDINGDGLPDRIMRGGGDMKTWYVQYNTGTGFAPTAALEGAIHPFIGASLEESASYAMENFWYTARGPGAFFTKLIDMNGDGLLDRVIWPKLAEGATQDHWYIQYGKQNGFEDAVLWQGIDSTLQNWQTSGEASSLGWYEFGRSSERSLSFSAIDAWAEAPFKEDCLGGYTTHGMFFCTGGYTHKMRDAISEIAAVFPVFGRFYSAYSGQSIGFDYRSETYQGEMLQTYVDVVPKLMADQAKLVDMNGDQKPDRVMLSETGSWYIQLNNGNSFDPAVLWDASVRALPNVDGVRIASSIRLSEAFEKDNILTDLRDVTGDGLPDRITIDQGPREFDELGFSEIYKEVVSWWKGGKNEAGRLRVLGLLKAYEERKAQHTWWVEVNNGHGFDEAVAWTGIYGNTFAETVITQNDRVFVPTGYQPYLLMDYKKVTDLIDLNGDKILDRVIYPEGQNYWLIQYGTGSGFLPVKEMKIESVSTAITEISSSRYDNLHVSLRAETAIPSTQGTVKVTLGDPAQPETYQEWIVSDLTTVWKDLYLPLNKNKANASEVRIQFLPSSGNAESVPVYVDNMTFTAFHPSDPKDWLDEMLVDADVVSEVNSARTQTLAQYLGLSQADSSSPDFNWDQLLNAETTIAFNAHGETQSFENLYGAVSKVENGQVFETILPDGSRIQFDQSHENSQTQTITNQDGSVENLQLSYGRVRTVTRQGKSPLEYSYKFDSSGQEITVVYDPETSVTERYLNNLVIEREQASGILTKFEYDSLGNLKKSDMTYKGRVRQTFAYGTSDTGNQLVHMEDGVVEEYSAEGKLLFHTSPDGYRYAHTEEPGQKTVTTFESETTLLPDGTSFTVSIPNVTFEPDPDVEKIYRVTLVDFQKSAGGDKAFYDADHLKSVRLADGTEISFDHFETVETTNQETGETVQEVKLSDVTVFHPDGTITEFKSGQPAAVISATGRTISLEMEGGYLINPNESAAFQKAQADNLWNELVSVKWETFRPASTLPVQMEYAADGALLTRKFGEGVVEIYDKGRIQEIVAPDGERLIEYQYDEEGNPTQIDMMASRRQLEAAVLKLKAEVAVEKEKSLAYLAEREQVLHETVEAQYTVTRDRLLALRSRIEDQANKLASLSVKGKKAQNSVGDAVQSIQVGLNQVNAALEDLAKKRIEALEQLSTQVRKASEDLETENQHALDQINAERKRVGGSILKQEVSPVIYHWYRKILGRDPSQAEYDRWVDYVIANEEVCHSREGGNPCPQEGEVPAWLADLKAELNASAELTTRTAEVNAIKSRVAEKLNQYSSWSEIERKAFAESMGVIPADAGIQGELVSLSAAEISAISSWLNNQSLHFGQSAYIALEAMLLQAGYQKSVCHPEVQSPEGSLCYDNGTQSFSRIQLATELILTDILTGTLTPLETGDLVLSLYAMKRFAARQGLETDGYSLDYDALKEAFVIASVAEQSQESCHSNEGGNPCSDFRIVAHINGNHYVIITNVTDTEVTYIDPGAGAESALQTTTISKDEFLNVWLNSALPGANQGVIFASLSFAQATLLSFPQSPSGNQNEYSSSPVYGGGQVGGRATVLTTQETMRVRGAFFPLLIPVFVAIVSAVVSAVSAAVAAIVTIISGILAGIGAMISGIGSLIGGVLSGNLLAGLQGLFSGVLHGLGTIGGAIKAGFVAVHGALLGGIQGIAGSIPYVGGMLSSATSSVLFSEGLALGMIGFAIDGVASIAERLGVSPKFARTISSIGKVIAGVGLIASGQVYGLAGSLSFIGSGTSEFLNLHTNLSPAISNVIGIGATALGVFAGGGFDPNVTGAALFKQALPSLGMDFATTGVSALGNALGLSPTLSNLISVPVQVSVGRSLSGTSASILSSLKENFLKDSLSGIVSLGSSIALDKLGVPQSATAFLNQYLGQAFSNAAGQITDVGKNAASKVFSSLSAGIQKFGSAAKTLTGNVVSFGQKVLQQTGEFTANAFKKTLSTFSSLFDRKTQEALHQDYAGIKEGSVSVNGDTWTWKSGDQIVTYDSSIGVAENRFGVGGVARITGLGTDDSGGLYYEKLNHESAITEQGKLLQTYEEGSLKEWGLISGNDYMKYKAIDGYSWNSIDRVLDTGIIDLGQPPAAIDGTVAVEPPQYDQGLTFSFKFLGGTMAEASVELQPGTSEAATVSGKTSKYLFGNGFNNEIEPEGTPDLLMPALIDDLTNKDKIIDKLKTLLIPMYETTGLVGNTVDWAQDFIFKLNGMSDVLRKSALFGNLAMAPIFVNTLDSNNLIEEVKKKILELEKNKNVGVLDKGIAFAHSGFFAPLLGALEEQRDDGSYFDIQTIISYEGPNANWNDYIENPNLKRIINVWGTAPNSSPQIMSNRIPGCSPNGKTIDCIDPTKKAIQLNDFGPPSNPANILLEWSKANFTGSAPGGIENVNIKILNARHNDFSYDAALWNVAANQFEPERIAQEINRKTNKFMRALYQFTLIDQETPGRLTLFLDTAAGISFDSADQVWVVDPDQLEL